MPDRARLLPRPRERLVFAMLAVLALGCLVAAAAITVQVLGRLDAYGSADSDNPPWTIAQLEVDQMRFRLALARLDPADPGTATAARRAFDLLYSRAMTLHTGPAYREILDTGPARAELRAIIALLGEMMPVIDSTDAAIFAGHAQLVQRAEALTEPIRALAAQAIALDARHGDAERAALTEQIVTLTALSLAMMLALGGLLWMLWRLYRSRLAARVEAAAARERELRGLAARARFLAMVSHEMRTPLNSLLGALELLEDSALAPEQARLARIMRISGAALRGHIDEALDGLQAETGHIALHPAPFDLDAMLAELIESQRAAAERRGNRLLLALPEGGLGHVTGDRQRLGQVLLNLLANAVKFTSGGSITLAAEHAQDGTGMVFRVTDTGIGIPEADLPRVFEDFVRLPAPDGAEREGSGLGLGIARQIVTRMGGQIAATSRAGEGSCFTVRLALPPAAPPGAAPEPTAPLRVLVVEDTHASRIVLAAMLARDGHTAVLSRDGLDGVRQAGRGAVDLIVMDLDMPRLDGVAAARRIRAGAGPNARTPIVALTAHCSPADRARLREAGIDAIETKPLSRARLRALLRQAQAAPALIDRAHLAQLAALMPATGLDAALAGLRAEAEALLALSETTPPEVLRPRIHRLAGTAATCGARALHALLGRIEAALVAGRAEEARALRAALPALWQDTEAALRPHRTAA